MLLRKPAVRADVRDEECTNRCVLCSCQAASSLRGTTSYLNAVRRWPLRERERRRDFAAVLVKEHGEELTASFLKAAGAGHRRRLRRS